MTDIRALGKAMRDAQRAYFKNRSRENLIASKQAESMFDKALTPAPGTFYYPVEGACEGCGSTETIEQIRASNPNALSCCPERKMLTATQWRERAERAQGLVLRLARMIPGDDAEDNALTLARLIEEARKIVAAAPSPGADTVKEGE